jgi:hypothetical protein
VADFDPKMPTLQRRDERWVLDWDRSVESRVVADWLSDIGPKSAVIDFANVGSIAASKIIDAQEQNHRKRISYCLYSSPNYLWCALAGLSIADANIFPTRLGFEILRYSHQANPVSYASSFELERMARQVRRAAKEQRRVTMRNIIEANELSISADLPILDIEITSDLFQRRSDSSAYKDLFLSDVADAPKILAAVSSSILILPRYYVGHPRWDQILAGTVGIKALTFGPDPNTFPGELRQRSERLTSAGGLALSIEQTSDVLAPVLKEGGRFKLGSMETETLLQSASHRARVNPSELVFAEEEIQRVLGALTKANAEITNDDVSPRPAPLDAGVVDGRLVLAGDDAPESEIPLEQLDAVRETHLEDVSRLSEQLRGTNAGPGFLHRLDALAANLGSPLTHSSSLRIATQVRALEDMFPAIGEALTEATAADVSATVTGLGLFIRQFPAWTRFVESARKNSDDFEENPRQLEEALEAVTTELINSSSDIADDDIKEAVSEIAEAYKSTRDRVLRFGWARSVGNVFRAVGRYLKERRDRSIVAFNKELDEGIGGAAGKLVVASFVLAVSAAMIQLAGMSPTEFGWILALYTMLRPRK